MKKLVLMVLSCMGLLGLADVQINNLEARQRYPWNGKVDITFDVVANAGSSGMLQIKAFDTARNNPVLLRSFTLDGVTHHAGDDKLGRYPVPRLSGSHTIVWDSIAEGYHTDNGQTRLTYEVSIITAHQSPQDALGDATGILGDVFTVDLATGAIGSFPQADTGTFNCDTYKTTKMAFVKIAAGAYVVGAGESAACDTAASPVTLTQDYYLSMFQCTKEQYQLVHSDNPQDSNVPAMGPVGKVSWNDLVNAGGFIPLMNAKTGANATFRLPTEVEWEIASRAGATTTWFFGATEDAQLAEYAWYNSNGGQYPKKVGTKKSNPWGFYDMYGNVWEWCFDWYVWKAYPSAATDPTGADSAPCRSARGGTCKSTNIASCSSAYRGYTGPTDRISTTGVRFALVVATPASH